MSAWQLKAWHQRVAVSLLVVRLAIAIALLPFAIDWRSPLLADHRPVALSALVAVPLLLIAIAGWMLRSRSRTVFAAR